MPLNLIGLAVLALLDQKSTDAEVALRHSFDRKSSTNVDAIVEKPFRGGDTMKVRIQYDSSGRRRTEVLWPATVQGRIFIDDGATWTTYNPATKVLRVHSVPPDEDLDARMHLIRRNYHLEIDARTSIAGRPAIRVVATPWTHDLRTQRFYLDAANDTPLKTETVDALGGVSVQFTVRKISFPGHLAKEAFTLPDTSGSRRENGHAPIPLVSSDDAFRRVGFRPAMLRHSIPMGFRPQGIDLMDRGGQTPVAIRLSDGLVRMYVFQSRVGSTPTDPHDNDGAKVAQDVNEVHIEVRGDDVPVAARERVLAAYVAAFQRPPKP